MICYVFTCQTVPLFFTVTKFGIALPKWIIERENSIWENPVDIMCINNLQNIKAVALKL
jgi:hypothetical protein